MTPTTVTQQKLTVAETFAALYSAADEEGRYALDERAAIREYDGGLSREEAEARAGGGLLTVLSVRSLRIPLKMLAPNLRAVGLDVVPARVRGRSLVKIGKSSASSASSANVEQSQHLDCGESKPEGSEHANDSHGVETQACVRIDVNHSERTTFANDADDANKNPPFTRAKLLSDAIIEMTGPTHRRRVIL